MKHLVDLQYLHQNGHNSIKTTPIIIQHKYDI